MRSAGSETSGRLIFGLIVIGVGLLFMLDRLGLVSAGEILRWWPALLLALGITRLTGALGRRRVTSGAIFTLIGTWLLLRNLGIIDLDPSEFWPLILVVIGALMVGGALRRRRSNVEGGLPGPGVFFGRPHLEGDPAKPEPAAPAWNVGGSHGPVSDPASTISGFALWSSIERKVTSQDFRGGDITAIMGSHELDLRAARVAGDAALIDLFVVMGGVEIIVPEDWKVSCEAVPVMGGIEDHSKPPVGPPRGHLIIKGFVMMGGVEVKN